MRTVNDFTLQISFEEVIQLAANSDTPVGRHLKSEMAMAQGKPRVRLLGGPHSSSDDLPTSVTGLRIELVRVLEQPKTEACLAERTRL